MSSTLTLPSIQPMRVFAIYITQIYNFYFICLSLTLVVTLYTYLM